MYPQFGPKVENLPPCTPPQSLQYQSSRRQLNVRILCFCCYRGFGPPTIGPATSELSFMGSLQINKLNDAEDGAPVTVSGATFSPPSVLSSWHEAFLPASTPALVARLKATQESGCFKHAAQQELTSTPGPVISSPSCTPVVTVPASVLQV